jgi:hypothetical protein
LTEPTTYPTRKRSKTPWIIAGIVLLVLIACGIGSCALFAKGVNDAIEQGTPKVAASAPASGGTVPEATEDSREVTTKVGQSIQQSGDAEAVWTVTKVEQRKIAQYDQKPERGVFLLAHVKVSVTEGSLFACGCSFQFVDAKGKVYEVTFNSFKGRDEITGNELAAGQNTDGWVAFDVPKAALTGGKIKLELNAFTGTFGYWTL